jgi:hypothetical protein
MAEKKIGELLDSLNTTLELDDGDMVTDVVIIAKIVLPDGAVSLGIGQSETTTWLDQLGLVHGAIGVIRQGRFTQGDDDG